MSKDPLNPLNCYLAPECATRIYNIMLRNIRIPSVHRACKVLACHLRDLSFASAFIQHSSAAIDLLKSLAKDSRPGQYKHYRFPLFGKKNNTFLKSIVNLGTSITYTISMYTCVINGRPLRTKTLRYDITHKTNKENY